jgi:hypothetical protein
MKRIWNKLRRGEEGQALIIALILMLVGGLIIAPVLAYVGTGLKIGKDVHEKRMMELYAADAGVEDGIWKIKNDQVPDEADQPYTIADVNAKGVSVNIASVATRTYKITSVATSDDGSSTTLDVYVESISIFDYGLASKNDIVLKKDTTVTGDIYCEGEFDPPDDLVHDGDVVQGEQADLEWPSQEENEAFALLFKNEALVGGTYPGNLTIPMGPATVNLGPLYITGNLNIKKDNTIVMTGTVYVEGSIDMDKEAQLTGSGSIVAVGDIYLAKVYAYGIGGTSTIMSLNGDITFKKEAEVQGLIYAPKGTVTFDMYGVVTGAVVAENTISSDKGLLVDYDEAIGDRTDLPGVGGGGGGGCSIRTWEISLQQED